MTKKIMGWSPYCLSTNIFASDKPSHPFQAQNPPRTLLICLSSLPSILITCTSRSSSANPELPHHLYDCAINLVLGMTHPQGHLFSLSRSEMERHDKIHPRVTGRGNHTAFILSSRSRILRRVVMAVYKFPSSQQHHGQEPVPFSPDDAFEQLQGVTVLTKLEAGSPQRVPSGAYSMETHGRLPLIPL